jgi:hypothetical protein
MVKRRFPEVAQECDAVSFEMGTHTVGARCIFNSHPKEGHTAYVFAHGQFQWCLGNANMLRGGSTLSPRFMITALVLSLLHDCLANSQPEYRTTVVAAAVSVPSMGAKALP